MADEPKIDAQAHLDSLALLQDVMDYLLRLPTHPQTYHMAKRIEEHLSAPDARALIRRAELLAKDSDLMARVKSGTRLGGMSRYTPSGLPVMSATLLFPTLRLESPAANFYREHGEVDNYQRMAEAIGREIVEGSSFNLAPFLD